MVSWDSKIDNFASFFFFLLTIIKSGLLAGIRWSVCILKSHRSLCVAFSRSGAGFCICHLLVWSNLNFLHIFPWITQEFKPFFSIQLDLINFVVCIVSTCPLISKSSRPYTSLWELFRVHQLQLASPSHLWSSFFFIYLASNRYLFLFSLSFNLFFYLQVQLSPQFSRLSLFYWLSLGLVIWPRLDDPFVSISQKTLGFSFSRTDSGLRIHHMFLWPLNHLLHPALSSPTMFLR